MTSEAIEIRHLTEADKPAWRALWTGYLEFYRTSVTDMVYDTTFARLLSDDPVMPAAFVAVHGRRLVGLVHYMYHPHCWRIEQVCYLQDLFADPAMRGQGIGRKLIEAVHAQAAADGAPTVYWLTQDFNHAARQLYDRIATLTPFIKYQM